MSKSSLKSNVFEPQLSRFYRRANDDVFHFMPYVPKPCYPKFMGVELTLLKGGYDPQLYADIVVRVMEDWARGKNMNHIPYNTFLGKWAMERFLKVAESDTVKILTDDDLRKSLILECEVMVARSYIYANLSGVRRLRSIVQELYPFLQEDWIDLYENGEERPIEDALRVLRMEFRVKHASDYNAIIAARL